MDTNENKVSVIPGAAILGCLVTGVVGLKIALENDDGIGVIGAAIAFGVVVLISFRK